MRMQPYETTDRARVVGAVDGVFPPAAQRHGGRAHRIAGLPPGITFGSEGLSRLTSSGGDHAGLSCLLLIMAVPVHCLPARPTPTG